MQYFKQVNDEQYSWSLFFILNGLEYDQSKCQLVKEDLGLGMEVTRQVAAGKGLNIAEENRKFSDCQKLQVYTQELELLLLCNDKQLYLYTNKKEGEEVVINSIKAVGKYVYISKNEVCSPVYMRNGDTSPDTYFKTFKDFALNGHAEVGGKDEHFVFHYEPSKEAFAIAYNDDLILGVKGINQRLAYPFVYYVLRSLKGNEMRPENFKVVKIEKDRV